jgi:hypothetical protein
MGSPEGLTGGAGASGTSGLWYADETARKPVPVWAEEMVDLGSACAGQRRSTGERLIAAIAVPTRAYCAALAAVGAVEVPEPASPGVINGAEAVDAHFQSLAALRPGAAVTVRQGSAVTVGQFEGIDETGEEPMIVIRQPKFIQRIPKRSSHLIRARGRYFGCLLVGRINILEAEICGGDVVTTAVKPLQTLLKIARFSRSPNGAKSDIVAPGYAAPAHLLDAQPGLIVFDGASAFRRAREAWRGSAPWLVVLDRSAPSFAEGVQLVEDEYVQRGTRAPDPGNLPVPEACELMAFWSSR